jgi:hypothetical protein
MRKTSFVILMLLALSCCSTRPPTNVSVADLGKIELYYHRLFDLENKFSANTCEAFVSHVKSIYRGADIEGGAPFWYVEQQDLLSALRQLKVSPSENKRLRVYLMKKIGVVSSFVRLPRSIEVKKFVSEPDQYAFSETELVDIFQSKEPPFSKLLLSMLDNPDVYAD